MKKIIITENQFEKLMHEQSVEDCLKVLKNNDDWMVINRKKSSSRNLACESTKGIKDIETILLDVENTTGVTVWDKQVKEVPGRGCVMLIKSKKMYGSKGPYWVVSIYTDGTLVLTKWNDNFIGPDLDPGPQGDFKILWYGKWTSGGQMNLNYYGKWENGSASKYGPMNFYQEKVPAEVDADGNPVGEKVEALNGKELTAANYLNVPHEGLRTRTKDDTRSLGNLFMILLQMIQGK